MTDKSWMRKHREINDPDTFQEVYCENCGLCLSSASHPTFCFDTIYRDNPVGFNDIVYAKLCRLQYFEVDSPASKEDFKNIFCNDELCSEAIISNPGGVCPDECKNFDACYQTFAAQIVEFGDELLESDEEDGLDEEEIALRNAQKLRRRYGHVDSDYDILTPSANRILQTPLPASPNPQFPDDDSDDDDENQFFWMTYGMSKKSYFSGTGTSSKKAKSKITVFTNKNAEWTRTLKKIFGSK